MANTIENYRPATANVHGVWRNDRYDLDRGADVARYVARQRYVWPGGYELFALTDDGGVLCCDCCRSEYRLIAHSYPRNGWHVSAMDSAANYDEPLACDHCARSIIEDDGETEAA